MYFSGVRTVFLLDLFAWCFQVKTLLFWVFLVSVYMTTVLIARMKVYNIVLCMCGFMTKTNSSVHENVILGISALPVGMNMLFRMLNFSETEWETLCFHLKCWVNGTLNDTETVIGLNLFFSLSINYELSFNSGISFSLCLPCDGLTNSPGCYLPSPFVRWDHFQRLAALNWIKLYEFTQIFGFRVSFLRKHQLE